MSSSIRACGWIRSVSATAIPPGGAGPPTRQPGLWAQGWHRFRRNKSGMTGLALVVLLAFVKMMDALAPKRRAKDTIIDVKVVEDAPDNQDRRS